jgi:hypothetical protein
VRRGDRVLVLCTVTDADRDTYTMMINAIVYNHHGEAMTEITEFGVLFQSGQR